MNNKQAPSKKGKLKKLTVKRHAIQDLSPTKSVALKIKGMTVRAGYNEGGYGVMQSGSGGC